MFVDMRLVKCNTAMWSRSIKTAYYIRIRSIYRSPNNFIINMVLEARD